MYIDKNLKKEKKYLIIINNIPLIHNNKREIDFSTRTKNLVCA